MSASEPIYIIYDGDCPFCSAYVRMVRLRDAAGQVELLNARQDHPVVREVLEAGLDLDEGMALKMGDQVYHGDEVINRLAMMTSPSGAFNRLNAWVFRSPGRSRALYPWLRRGRNLALRALGRKKLAAS